MEQTPQNRMDLRSDEMVLTLLWGSFGEVGQARDLHTIAVSGIVCSAEQFTSRSY